MIVIADTGPINYLICISEIEVLPKLYGGILVPPAVYAELRSPRAPELVRNWITSPPSWLEMRIPSQAPDAELLEADLDAGERDAILLAQEMGADELIIDERRGRREAQRGHLTFTGTLGVLRAASNEGLIDLKGVVDRPRQTNFYIAQNVLDQLFKDQH